MYWFIFTPAITRTCQRHEAKEQLQAVYPVRKEPALTPAVVAGYQNAEAEFLRWAEQARRYFKAQVEARPGDPL